MLRLKVAGFWTRRFAGPLKSIAGGGGGGGELEFQGKGLLVDQTLVSSAKGRGEATRMCLSCC